MQRTGLLALTLFVACAGTLAAQLPQSALITQPTAFRYGLERAWFVQAEIDRSRSRLGSWYLDDGMLFTQTTQGVVQAFDAETGAVRWTAQIGKPGLPGGQVSAGPAGVVVVILDKAYLVDRNNGRVLWEQKLGATPLAGAGVGSDWIYVPLSNGKNAAFNVAEPTKDQWWYGSAGWIDTSPIVTKQSVVWINNRGMLHACDKAERNLQFEFEANVPASAPLGYWPPYVYFVDQSHNLFAVFVGKEGRKGRLDWRFSVGGPVHTAPVGIDGKVFIIREKAGMYCVNTLAATEEKAGEAAATDAAADEVKPAAAATPVRPRLPGEPIWFAPRIKQFVSASASRVYAIDDLNRLAILDLQTGGVIGVMPLDASEWKLSNNQTDRIYLATPFGLIQALHELDLREPHKHVWPEETQATPAVIQQAGDAEAGN